MPKGLVPLAEQLTHSALLLRLCSLTPFGEINRAFGEEGQTLLARNLWSHARTLSPKEYGGLEARIVVRQSNSFVFVNGETRGTGCAPVPTGWVLKFLGQSTATLVIHACLTNCPARWIWALPQYSCHASLAFRASILLVRSVKEAPILKI